MAFSIQKCTTEDDLEKYLRFFLKHRTEIMPIHPIKAILEAVTYQLKYGHIVIVTQHDGEIIGSVYYHYDVLEEENTSEELVIGQALLHPNFGYSKIFVKGFQFLLKTVQEEKSNIKNVVFYTYTNSKYLEKLYSKFARKKTTSQSLLGELAKYETSFEELSNFFMKFR